MSVPPTGSIRVPHGRLHDFVKQAALRLEIPSEQADLLADLLIATDLRGFHTHGSRGMLRYSNEIRSGGINPRPSPQVLQETPASLVIDGDGGLGYFPAHDGTRRLIEKANAAGMAALLTKNHGHIGAAGIYTRLTLPHDLLSFATSGHQLRFKPAEPVILGAGGPPMSFSAPGDQEPPLLLDAGVTQEVLPYSAHYEELTQLTPGLILRSLGFGAIAQAWGGMLAGLSVHNIDRRYVNATQGMFLFAFKISLFADPAKFKKEIDEYARAVRQLKPLPGTEGAFLPGGVEAVREKVNRESGIPLSRPHRADLETLAEELAIPVPWS